MRTRMFGLSLGVLLMVVPAMAQEVTTNPLGGPNPEVTPPGETRAYGAGVTLYNVTANAMGVLVSDTTFNFGGSGLNRFRTGGSLWFHAPVVIPSGGLMTSFEITACDTNAAATIDAFLHRCPILGGSCDTIASVSTGVAAVPGCAEFVDTTITTPTLDQDNFYYDISIAVTGTTNTTSVGSARIGWRRQVRPGPATATFVDVPTTSIFFQFVEALAAAGITGGCTTVPGGYCPAEPVTRAQMAAFLSIALGLHWPN